MRVVTAWARIGRWLMAALALAVAAGCGGDRNPSGNDVVVGASGPSGTVTPGATVVFTMTVENVGSNTASDVRLVNSLGAFLVLNGITCSSSGGAVCPPSPLSSTMTVPTLPVGGRLVFSVTALVNALSGGTVVNTLTANAVDDTGRLNNSATASATVEAANLTLGVAQDASTSVAAGASALFRVQISNPSGANVAGNVVLDWALTTPFAASGITYTCTATGGATCPADQTPSAQMSFNVGTVGAGRTLTFAFTVPVPADARGTLTSVATVAADSDGDLGNNSSTVSMTAVDARSGTYEVYAADGNAYQLTIDFDAGTYTMAGNGGSDQRTFTSDGNGGYLVAGNQRLRTAEDLVIGAHGFAGGVLPYVAARKFVTSVTALGGAFNLMLRNTPADGSAAITRAGTARFDSNALQVCLSDFEVVTAATCGSGNKTSWLLTVSGDVFTATDSAGSGRSFGFRVARSGAADIVLATGAAWSGDGSRQFSVGLADGAGLVASTVVGPGVYADAVSDWLTIRLTENTYTAEGALIADVTGLYRIDVLDAQAPTAMLQGAPLDFLQGAPVWVMQSYPLVVVVGATKSGPEEANASGLLQIGVP